MITKICVLYLYHNNKTKYNDSSKDIYYSKKVRVTKGTEVEVLPFVGVTGAFEKVIGKNFEMITTMGVINKLISE